ncbi:MAG TPA: hypothetical protein PLL52_03165 [Caldisericia bacterium]|nr:hypothetical protein [Caldisericia bacterium]
MGNNRSWKSNKINKRLFSFITFEVLLSLTIALIILIPVSSYLFKDILRVNKQIENENISMNLNYVVKQIREELIMSKFIDAEFRPINGESSTLLQFTRLDGKLVRYYKIGKEIVKDYNYSYNAITPKVISSFSIERNDLNGSIVLKIRVEGTNGEIVSRTIVKRNQS